MRIAWIVVFALPLAAYPGGAIEKMLDGRLTLAQRNDACYSLRGNTTQEAIDASVRGLHDPKVRACAEEDRRRAGAIDALKGALADDDPEVRAVAARTLGTFERRDLAPLIAKAGQDSQMLVATNAVEGLSYYQDRTAVPYLLELGLKTGVVGSLAIEQLIKLKEPQAVILARTLVKSADPADLLAAMRILGMMGDASDIPVLEQVAKRFPEASLAGAGRGFGFLPPISLDRAAKASIQQIHERQ